MTVVEILIHLLVLVLLPPLLLGVIVKTKAAFAGRKGAPTIPGLFRRMEALAQRHGH